MIGSHNSLSYSKSNIFFNCFSFLWKCQSMNLNNQLKKVDYFDIRIRFNKAGKIIFCHGIVDLKLNINFRLLMDLLKTNNKKCRVILERGKYKDLLTYLKPWIDLKIIQLVIIKKHWNILYGDTPKQCDFSYTPFLSDKTFWYNIKHLRISTIKIWAKKHNPIITNSIKHSSIIYFMDYII